jgi:hypothetical protein
MFQTLQVKLLVVVVALLAGISSYLAYESHQRAVEEQKNEKAFERMKTEGKKELPSGWAKSLKNK